MTKSKLKTEVMGRDIVALLESCKDYPVAKYTKPYAAKKGYDHMCFRFAMKDMWWGDWHKSEYRSHMCKLHTVPGVTWPKLVREKRKLEEYRASLEVVESEVVGKRLSRERTAFAAGVGLCDIMAEQGCKCYACGMDLIKSGEYDLDHIMPISKGGGNDYENLQFLCISCNRSKSDALPLVWAATNGVKLPDKFMQKYCT